MSRAIAAPPPEPPSSSAWSPITDRVRVSGKFFFAGNRKLYVKGVSYGPFRPGEDGTPFPDAAGLRRDFRLMRDLGANTLRTFTPPPVRLLDVAAEEGLRVVAGIPWAQHVCFLDDRGVMKDARDRVAATAREIGGHPALLALFIGNETPPDIVRWYGPERVEEFLRSLFLAAKDPAPEVLVSYANYPPTEYLSLDFLDFLSFNVYLHHEPAFRRYVMRLHNLAEDKPIFLSEFGIDSIREGADHQAEILGWQVRAAFELGVSGAVVFAWTDDWYSLGSGRGDGFQVTDWAFGLVDLERRPKPSFHAVQRTFAAPTPPLPARCPSFSVVVCAYNAERTMEPCLESLRDLPYPNYEVIIVNDGSTDRTLEISRRYEGGRFRLIDQKNMGLSAARNVGIEAARNEIVTFTDSDCVVDPDWLTYLAYKFDDGFVAVGGPNFPPPEDSLVPSAVAVSPGGPTHVLLEDDVAEHIPGCNMSVRKAALEEISGFDVLYTAAGDDVDVCWRLQDRGHAIGFSPVAVVWHFRRNTVRAYLKQQMGYGKAEALLYFKHPYRFNLLGQSRWLGRIYGDLTTSFFARRPVIYYGAFGRGLFQTLYERPASLFTYLPFTLEWNLLAAILLITSLLSGEYLVVSSIPFAISLLSAATTAARAKLDPRFRGPRARLLVMLLLYLGPLMRSFERYLWRIRSSPKIERMTWDEPQVRPDVRWFRRTFYLTAWNESAREKEDFLGAIAAFLVPRKYTLSVDSGWNDWDIEVSRGLWARARIKAAVENHGGQRRVFRVRTSLHAKRPPLWTAAACAGIAVLGGALGLPELVRMGLVLGGVAIAALGVQCVRFGRDLVHVLNIVAGQLDMVAVSRAEKSPSEAAKAAA